MNMCYELDVSAARRAFKRAGWPVPAWLEMPGLPICLSFVPGDAGTAIELDEYRLNPALVIKIKRTMLRKPPDRYHPVFQAGFYLRGAMRY